MHRETQKMVGAARFWALDGDEFLDNFEIDIPYLMEKDVLLIT